MESVNKKDEGSKRKEITLSSALLAPINSIFEAQIHSARAFLNFIMQMGFRHQPTPKDIKTINSDPEKYANEFKQLQETEEAKKEIAHLLKEKQENGILPESKVNRLKVLIADYGDLYQQTIDFVDNTGNQFMVNVPNLSLLPIKPLTISEAEFNYEFEVMDSERFDQMGAALGKEEGKKERPWFLIKDPQSIRGNFAARKDQTSESSIKVNVKVTNTDIPYGLEKLLVHLSNSMEAISKKEE